MERLMETKRLPFGSQVRFLFIEIILNLSFQKYKFFLQKFMFTERIFIPEAHKTGASQWNNDATAAHPSMQ
jgi:hypothetical protein